MKGDNNNKNVPVLITVVGRSNSGKTTLIEKLIIHFSARGKRLAVIKTMHHVFQFDQPGSDTSRLKNAGAAATVLSNGSQFALVSDAGPPLTPIEIAERYLLDMDIVFIEGYKGGDTMKVEIIGDSEEEPLFMSGISPICMIVSDRELITDLSVFKRDDIHGISAEMIRCFFPQE